MLKLEKRVSVMAIRLKTEVKICMDDHDLLKKKHKS